MDEVAQSKFEGYAIVEMMGHRREIGFVTTENYGAASLFRIDTPGYEEREYVLERPTYLHTENGYRTLPEGTKVKRPALPARSVLIGPASIYALNPCTEEAARLAIEKMVDRPLILLSVPESAQIPAHVGPYDIENGDEDEESF